MSRYPAFLAGRCSNGAERDRGNLGRRHPGLVNFSAVGKL